MELEELIKIASAGYPDGLVMLYFKEPDTHHGDGLAKFVMAELSDTYEDEGTDEEQLAAAVHYIETAQKQLHEVITALEVTR